MAGLLSRFTTFIPNTTILSNDHNQELNRIVNLLAGVTTNLKTVLKTSDAGDAPLELDQLSTGPIQKWFQGGVLKATMANDGALSITGNIIINNAAPTITFDDTAGTDAKIDLDASALRLGSLAVNQISLDVSTGIATFSQIPILPASNPTTDNQATRKLYVDGRKTAFSIAFFIQDPSAPTVDATISGVPAFVMPEGVNITITKILVLFKTGTHTSTTSVTFSAFKRAANGTGGTTIASINLDDTNNTAFVVYEVNIDPDVVLNQKDSLDVFIDARTGTVAERDVSVVLIGTQTLA